MTSEGRTPTHAAWCEAARSDRWPSCGYACSTTWEDEPGRVLSGEDARMTEPAEARITCQAMPWQAEGRLHDGRWFYMRVRHNVAELGLGATLDDAIDDSENDPSIDGAPHSPTDDEGWALFHRLLDMRQDTAS